MSFLPVTQDSFYRGLTAEESERAHEYNFDHPGNVFTRLGCVSFVLHPVNLPPDVISD